MTDPRYRNGLFTNQRAINREHRLGRRLQYERSHPLSHGWEFSHWNKEFDMPVYTLGDAKLMHYKDNWLVEYPHYETPVFYQGWPIEKVTEDTLKELSKWRGKPSKVW